MQPLQPPNTHHLVAAQGWLELGNHEEAFEAFCDHLRARAGDRPEPVVVDPRGAGRNTDLNLDDPSGNTLTFWEPLEG